MNGDPLWLAAARRYIGVAEIPGKAENPVIGGWLRKLRAAWDSESVPWCGTFVATCLQEVGLPIPQHWYRARAYLDYGTSVLAPTLGCIVVFARAGGGHVGFAVGRNEHGALLILGGNQGDRVSIAAFDPARVLGYRWPPGAPYTSAPLARYVGNHTLSNNEA